MYSITQYNSTIRTIFQNQLRLNQNVDTPIDTDAITNVAINVGVLAKNINEEFNQLAEARSGSPLILAKKYTKTKTLQELLGRVFIKPESSLRKLNEDERLVQILNILDKIFRFTKVTPDGKIFSPLNILGDFQRLPNSKIDPELTQVVRIMLSEPLLAFYTTRNLNSTMSDLQTTISDEVAEDQIDYGANEFENINSNSINDSELDEEEQKSITDLYHPSLVTLGAIGYECFIDNLEKTWMNIKHDGLLTKMNASDDRDEIYHLFNLLAGLRALYANNNIQNSSKSITLLEDIFNKSSSNLLEANPDEDLSTSEKGPNPNLVLISYSAEMLSYIKGREISSDTSFRLQQLFNHKLPLDCERTNWMLLSDLKIANDLDPALVNKATELILKPDADPLLKILATKFFVNNPQLASKKMIEKLVNELDKEGNIFHIKTILNSWLKVNQTKPWIKNALLKYLNEFCKKTGTEKTLVSFYEPLSILAPLLKSSKNILNLIVNNVESLSNDERNLLLATAIRYGDFDQCCLNFSEKEVNDPDSRIFSAVFDCLELQKFIKNNSTDIVESPDDLWPSFVRYRLLANYKIDELTEYLFMDEDKLLRDYFLVRNSSPEFTSETNIGSLLAAMNLEVDKLQTIDESFSSFLQSYIQHTQKDSTPINTEINACGLAEFVLKKIETNFEPRISSLKRIFDLHTQAYRTEVRNIQERRFNQSDNLNKINEHLLDCLEMLGADMKPLLVKIGRSDIKTNDPINAEIKFAQKNIINLILGASHTLPDYEIKNSLSFNPTLGELNAVAA